MNNSTNSPITIAIIYLWIGFICAISFMEAWLKFRAPGVNLEIGLGIGRLVFGVLNKVEWGFAIVLVICLFYSKDFSSVIFNLSLYLPLILLIIQTIWILPTLDERAQMYIDGKTVPPSNLHIIYIAIEIIKTMSLIIYSIKFLK